MSVKKRKKSGPFITAVDLGTSKICVVIAEMTDDGVDILSVTSSPSAGLRKGVVVDIESAAAAIREALAAARSQSGVSTREALVSISGNHIQVHMGMAAVPVGGKSVSPEDVDKVIEAAGNAPLVAGRDIIHVLPTDFIIDGGRGIKDPVGMPGSRLEAKVNIITASSEPLKRLVMSCEKAGLQVADIVLQSIASAESALSAEDREMGTALIDIGGGTTDIALFKDGWLQHTMALGIGGNHFTNDLSVGLNVPFTEAERIKKQFGTLDAEETGEEIDVIGRDSKADVVRKVSGKLVTRIIHLRAEELLELVKKEINRLQGQDAITGAVFTGGGVLVPFFERFAETFLSMPVRMGYPDLTFSNISQSEVRVPFVSGVKEPFNSPQYAAGIGMVLYGVGFAAGRQGPSDAGLFTKMTGFLKNLIGRKK